MPHARFEAVLFDLDGTLADTAPDLNGALNDLLASESRPALPPAILRPHTSSGTRGMLRVGFNLRPGDDNFPRRAAQFLPIYAQRLCRDTRLFAGMATLLNALDHAEIPWGVVTNKPARFTEPLLDALNLSTRAACIVSGDSTHNPKPAPDPLLLGCKIIGCATARTLYVGDDLRDIQAARAATMPAAAAAWGYLGIDTRIEDWQADWIVDSPNALLALCELPLTQT